MNSFTLMTGTIITLLLSFSPAPGQPQTGHTGKRLNFADSLVHRVQPSAFDSLPEEILTYLEREGYTIPQCWYDSMPSNVISGSFAKKGQRDWAVLASRDKKSCILIFWNGSANNPSAIATGDDTTYLQSIGDNKIAFSRFIRAAGKEFIMEHFEAYGGTTPPAIDHEGIEDGVAEGGSVVFYFYEGEWLSLAGAD